jgi:microcystin-dependent protein
MTIAAYRARQTSGTVGTGTLALISPAGNLRSFASALGAVSQKVLYVIQGESQYEIGWGTYDGATPGTLARSNVIVSSNANALVAFNAGVKDVFVTYGPGQRQIKSISTTTTLVIAEAGALVVYTGTGHTVTLPLAASMAPGSSFELQNFGTGVLTVSRAGAETINGATTVTLTPRETCTFYVTGTSAWAASLGSQKLVPIGTTLEYSGTTLPFGYLWENGANVSRTTYALLFAAIGTTYGVGDGSTTFAVPDSRGRVAAGKDDMGGSAANRLTNAISGVTGTTLGGVGGSQSLQSHSHLTADNVIAGASGGAVAVASGNVQTGTTGAGASQNVQPTIIKNKIIYAGV